MALIEIRAPQFAESIVEGALLQWCMKIGEPVVRGEVIVEIEMDKVILEISAPSDGVLREILKEAGDAVLSDEVIATIDSEMALIAEPKEPLDKSLKLPTDCIEENAAARHAEIPMGRTPDLERHEERIPMSRIRARIAERVVHSQTSTATLTTFNEVNMKAIIDLRDANGERFKQENGVTLGLMAFFVRAAIFALKKYPILNASVEGKDIVLHSYFDIGIAISSPRGLVVPVLRNADRMSIAEIERGIRDFGLKAKSRKLVLDDLTGGTFSISNGGVFGSMFSVPIINPPQSAILGIHAIKRRPVAEQGRTVIRPMSYLALSYDHRLIDGREAVLGLAAMTEALENPMEALVTEAERAGFLEIPPSTSQEVFGGGRTSPGSLAFSGDAERNGPSEAPGVADQEELVSELKASLANILCLKSGDIDSDVQFTDLGLDSVTIVDWSNDLSRQYREPISATAIYAYPSIRQFAAFLSLKLKTPNNAEPGSVETPGSVSRSSRSESLPGGENSKKDLIAIIGMSGRYPGAGTLEQYWDNLRQGRNSIVEIPRSRWNLDDYYDPRPFQEGKTSSKWLGAMDGVDFFDPLFFGIAPADAETMDPQQRIFLQEAYRAIEHAGYAPKSLSDRKCGVYLGLCNNDYGLLLRAGGGVADRVGNSCAIGSARIAYYLNLKGPAITVDTACSSSLVAIHLANQALQSRETDLALAGGISLYLAPELYLCWSAAGVLSRDGQCKTFDNVANGFVPGDGVGVVVLKRLSDAERDGDHILGVILGSGINQDGKTNGITAPSMTRQSELVREIYTKHGIRADSISYVEAHGTGTKLGDPTELEALAAAFKVDTAAKNFCAIGSVKSNIGHSMAAAGVAGVQKILLSLKNRQLPPTINFQKHNKLFNFSASPFFVNTELRSWGSSEGERRRAAVSSFGISGTNAHLVLEEYVPSRDGGRLPVEVAGENQMVIVLSARTDPQLRIHAAQILEYIELHAEIDLSDAAYTLQIGRDAMEHRLAFVVSDRESLLRVMRSFVDGKLPEGVHSARALRQDAAELHGRNDDVDALIRNWISEKKLSSIADAWVKGANVNWLQLHRPKAPQRVGLPCYPFAQERYWIPDVTDQARASFAPVELPLLQASSDKKFDIEFWSRLIDDVISDEVDVDAAALEVKKILPN